MYWKRISAKAAAGVCAAAFCLQTAMGTVVPAKAEAFDLGDALGAVIGTAVQYNYLNKQVHHIDNEGRNEYYQQMRAEIGVNKDPELNAILDDIMARLSASIARTDSSITEKPYNYFINNEKTYNAFCTLGHNLSVNTGMFDLVENNIDELAVVLAHEIGHGQKNHVSAGIKKSMPLDLLTNLYNSQNPNAASVIGSRMISNSVKATQMTKPQEVEADNLAFDYTVGAGYNIGAGAAVWQRFIDKMGESKSNFVGDLFSPSDHPSHQSRRDSYSEKLTKYSKDNVKVNNKTGEIKIKGKSFMTPEADASRSAQERSYFIAGNLAAVYHNQAIIPKAVWDGNVIKMGNQPILVPAGAEDVDQLVARLNKIR